MLMKYYCVSDEMKSHLVDYDNYQYVWKGYIDRIIISEETARRFEIPVTPDEEVVQYNDGTEVIVFDLNEYMTIRLGFYCPALHKDYEDLVLIKREPNGQSVELYTIEQRHLPLISLNLLS
jgi:hypothetical protein